MDLARRRAAVGPAVRVLVVNAGSSSLRLRTVEAEETIATCDLPPLRDRSDEEALTAALADLPPPDAVGHRIVHGGTTYHAAVRVCCTESDSLG